MHLQQTKRASSASGGPQYYFHDLTESVKTFLRKKGAVRVALLTPYGATKSDFFAVSKDHKISGGKVVAGSVGHDRIQQGGATESIGESIRNWYKLPNGQFERIDLEIDVIDDIFYITPTKYKYATAKKSKELQRIDKPLTFTHQYMSPFWKRQLAEAEVRHKGIVEWAIREICRIAADHRPGSKLAHIQEPDILRASGPLLHFGVKLGGYVGKGYDCVTDFQFLEYPIYSVPVELKRNSNGFSYQQKKYGKDELSRAVVLCAIHNHKSVPKNIDIIELDAFCKYAKTDLSLSL